jgi:hypothetical protein
MPPRWLVILYHTDEKAVNKRKGTPLAFFALDRSRIVYTKREEVYYTGKAEEGFDGANI